jgi:hypothetical protein
MLFSKEMLEQFSQKLNEAKSYEDLMGKDGVIKKLLGHFDTSRAFGLRLCGGTSIQNHSLIPNLAPISTLPFPKNTG